MFRFVDVLVCRRFGLSTFRFVDVSVCRRFGLSTFRFDDVSVWRRFGCRRFGLSTFWPVFYVTNSLMLEKWSAQDTFSHFWATVRHLFQTLIEALFCLPFEYHLHIWQVPLQHSCGGTCQIWMWFNWSKGYFCKSRNICDTDINSSDARDWIFRLLWSIPCWWCSGSSSRQGISRHGINSIG